MSANNVILAINFPDDLFPILGVAATLTWFAAIIVWSIRRKFGKTKTCKATVVNKQINETFSKYSGNGKEYRYYVTFRMNGKRRSFAVSQFSYSGYRIGETGTLKYKADRLIDFR